jgi:hypothetical protein
MKDPKIKTKVVHSTKNSAWNVIGDTLGGKFKIARVPYQTTDDVELTARWRLEALDHANFISACFNNSDWICQEVKKPEEPQKFVYLVINERSLLIHGCFDTREKAEKYTDVLSHNCNMILSVSEQPVV